MSVSIPLAKMSSPIRTKQVEPLQVRATAELLEGQIRIAGEIETKVELVCARCLEPVVEEVNRSFDLFYSFVSQQCFGFHCPLFLKMMAYMHDILGSICFLEKPD